MERSRLEQMSSQELHRRAIDVAKMRGDASFMWELVKAIPAAQAAVGNVDEAQLDVMSLNSLLSDVLRGGETELAEGLRPLYVDYLAEHA
jgi:hypothetical protein